MLHLDDTYRVMFEKNNFRLEKLEDVTDRKTGETKQSWKHIGYYGNLIPLLNRYVQEKIRDQENVFSDELIQVLKELEKSIERTVKKSNIRLDLVQDSNPCQICGETTTAQWTLRISDEREKKEFVGHKECINQLVADINMIDKNRKKPVNKILSELNLNV